MWKHQFEEHPFEKEYQDVRRNDWYYSFGSVAILAIGTFVLAYVVAGNTDNFNQGTLKNRVKPRVANVITTNAAPLAAIIPEGFVEHAGVTLKAMRDAAPYRAIAKQALVVRPAQAVIKQKVKQIERPVTAPAQLAPSDPEVKTGSEPVTAPRNYPDGKKNVSGEF